MANLSDLVGFALALTTRFQKTSLVNAKPAKIRHFELQKRQYTTRLGELRCHSDMSISVICVSPHTYH